MPLLYVSPLLLSGLIGLILAVYIARRPNAPGLSALLALTLAAAFWSICYAVEILVVGLEAKLFWAKLQYLGIGSIPLSWLIFSVERFGPAGWLRRAFKYRLVLLILPITICALVFTNELHNLVWREVSTVQVGPVTILHLVYGPYFWINLGFSYVLLLWGSIRLVQGLSTAFTPHRWQTLLVLLAAVVPWVGNLAYVLDLGPIPGLDWTPFSFIVATLLFTISLLRFQLINILPIAQKKVFDDLPDSLLVLDASQRIVSVNPAARNLLRAPSSHLAAAGAGPKGSKSASLPVSTVTRLLGTPLARLDSPLAGWIAQAGCTVETCFEVSLGEGHEQRFFELHIKPIGGSSTSNIGCLVVLHDITVHKQDQAALEQARDLLEATVAERTASLQEAVARLEIELAQRTLAEKQFADVIEAAPDALLLVDPSDKIVLVNARAERLFGYTRAELVGKHMINTLAPPQQRARQRREIKRYLANPNSGDSSFGIDLSARRKDGSEFPVEISVSTLDTAGGFWLVFNVRDISQRVQAEQARQQLLEEISQSHAQLSALAGRLQTVQESERRQIADRLHDRVGQYLTGLNLNLQAVRNQFDPDSDIALCRRLDESIDLLEETTRQVRGVMAELHPPMLEEYGLAATLRWYCGVFSQQSGIAASLSGEGLSSRLPLDVELALFRLVQESLNNVAKHARARRVSIQIGATPRTATLSVEDDGQGFDPHSLNPFDDPPHWGLITMQQRVASIGGELAIQSVPGQGTRITIKVRRSKDED